MLQVFFAADLMRCGVRRPQFFWWCRPQSVFDNFRWIHCVLLKIKSATGGSDRLNWGAIFKKLILRRRTRGDYSARRRLIRQTLGADIPIANDALGVVRL